MGVEYELFCHKCKKRIDLHKLRLLNALIERDAPLNYDSAAFEKNRESFDQYWLSRAFWFLWKHREHGDQIVIHSDHDNDYWEIRDDFEEVGLNK